MVRCHDRHYVKHPFDCLTPYLLFYMQLLNECVGHKAENGVPQGPQGGPGRPTAGSTLGIPRYPPTPEASLKEALPFHWAPHLPPHLASPISAGTGLRLGKQSKPSSGCLENGCCFPDFATWPSNKTACFAFLTQALQCNIIKRGVRNAAVFWWTGQLLIFNFFNSHDSHFHTKNSNPTLLNH